MNTAVVATEDAALVLDQSGDFLTADPVNNNVLLTLLTDRAQTGQPGRYWIGFADGDPAGVVFQSPLEFFALVTAMPDDVLQAVIGVIAEGGVALPGVNGDAAAASRFAGHWTERLKVPASPVRGIRVYEVTAVRPPHHVPGEFRSAAAADREQVIKWEGAFHDDIGERAEKVDEVATDRRIAAGQVFIWQNEDPVSMAIRSNPVAGVSRVQAVYTPPEHRARGYAAACVAELSARILAEGQRCILYTDLANPTSNSVYRRIGYQAVGEGLRYRFG